MSRGSDARFAGATAPRIGGALVDQVGWPAIVAAASRSALGSRAAPIYWRHIFPPVAIVPLGMAVAAVPLTTPALSAIDAHHVGTASGLNSAVSRGGGLIVVVLLGLVLSRRGEALVEGLHDAALAGAALALVSALIAFATLGSFRPAPGTA